MCVCVWVWVGGGGGMTACVGWRVETKASRRRIYSKSLLEKWQREKDEMS